ncbi:hypothetical protein HHK36_004868 [Tetracentron sinense]|uniref:Uncharacterized protein n=1 Tax=Tetracentron sinense TaxID=13715 RepID=A0A835DQ91_TETSI|nr:hypothetical protein HHK36_004868 [Tetracentron sinense]
MACMKLGSKTDAFKRQGQAWFCTTGLPSDVVVEVGEMSFHLHKFPLLSRSGVMERLIAETSEEGEERCIIHLPDLPGGAKTFELVARFCYGVKFEITASNVVYLRCAAEHLEMTEHGEDNLIAQTEVFFNQVVLRIWKDSLKALQTCEDVLPQAEDLHIIRRCIASLAAKACTDPNLFGLPMMEHSGPMQSLGESTLWNGISTGARPRNSSLNWWYEDVSTLSLPLYKRLISVMESQGIKQETIAGSLTFYAKRYLPGLNRRQGVNDASTRLEPVSLGSPPSEEDQKLLLEEIDGLIPMQKGLTSTKFLFGLLRIAMILRASPSCISNLERRIGMQLDQATLDDILMPNFSYSMETLYNVECVQRILEHFFAMDQATGGASPCSVDDGQLMGSPSLTPITMVAKLIDGFLSEVAPDVNLKPPKFHSLASGVPDYARPLDDGLYRAIDIYLKVLNAAFSYGKPLVLRCSSIVELLSSYIFFDMCFQWYCTAMVWHDSIDTSPVNQQDESLPVLTTERMSQVSHPWLTDSERENLCRVMDCQKLSLEACTHAAQNERLPLKVIVQVLFFEQMQLRTSIAGCFLVSDNLDGSRQFRGGMGSNEGGRASAVRENQVLKVGMDSMRMRVTELEEECSRMRHEIEKLGQGKGARTSGSVSKKFGFKMKSKMCSTQEESISSQNNGSGKVEKAKDRHGKHKNL